jgi:thioredoxin reductase
MLYDAIIVGGGPAGLSAALILGRCLRKVLVLDHGKPRNARTDLLHGFLTRDGVPPTEFYSLARAQLRPYQNVELETLEVTKLSRDPLGVFQVKTAGGACFHSKKLLLATGVVDQPPDIPGLESLYGKSVFHCPYCDGWELRNQPLAVYGKSGRGLKMALSLRSWSHDIVLCTDGPAELDEDQKQELKINGISLREEKIDRLEGTHGFLERVVFANGDSVARRGLFFNTPSTIRSKLLEQLGCCFSQEEGVSVGKYAVTSVPGLYVAGNILREVQLVIVAAAEGAEAAFGIHSALAQEERDLLLKTYSKN